MLTMNELKTYLEYAKNKGYKYFGIKFKTTDGFDTYVFPNSKFELELEYYRTHYNNDLTYRHSKRLKIISFNFANELDELNLLLN